MKRIHTCLTCLGALVVAACGASDAEPEGGVPQSERGPGDDAGPSPPGEDPDPAKPMDPTEESRAGAAEPCAMALDTGFINDELCLAPPSSELGFQLHFGPDSVADYDDPDALRPFVLAAGEENTVCQYRRTPNDETRFVMEQHLRVRSGTHHLLVWGSPGEQADLAAPPEGSLVEGENCGAADNYLFQTGLQSALGAEGGVSDIPNPEAEVAPEDRGLARLVRPHASVVLEMHYINTSESPILREAWVNSVYTPEEEVTAVVDPLMFLGGLGMEVPAQSTEVVGAGPCEAPPETGAVRILGVNGHGHAHMSRLSAWVERADGQREPIYETYDWAEPLLAQFNSVAQNPAMDQPDADGAYSGVLTLSPGDRVFWECEVENRLDQPLRWANEAYTSEMCNLFGYYTIDRGKQANGNWNCFTF